MNPTVIVTGAAQGIGLETARQLNDREWSVLGVDILQPEDGTPFVEFVHCDLSDDVAISECVKVFAEQNGHIDGLVNNAVITTVGGFLDSNIADLDAAYAVNVRGLFWMAREVAKVMSRQEDGGSIVNVSSVNGERGVTGTAIYSTTKGSVAAFTRAIAVELAPLNIRVNCVAPAPTGTQKLLDMLDEEQLETRVRRIPAGRLGDPKDVASAISYLLMPEARFITGTTLPIDGGYMAFGL